MLSNVNSNIFLNSNSIELQPVISAEWNHNLFNAPYITVAGSGTPVNPTLQSGSITTGGIDSQLPGFSVNSFTLAAGNRTASGNVVYTASGLSSPAYKVVIYFKTNNNLPISINGYGKGQSNTQYGSSYIETNSYGWTKLETYIGGYNSSDTITTLNYTISANSLNSDSTATTVYFTPPQFFATTFFDYQYHSLWPTDSAFTYFRPGESYVTTGNSNAPVPSTFRKINRSSNILNGYAGSAYSPVSAISQSPSFTMAKQPVPLYKNSLPNEMATYKYFVSDTSSQQIAALYSQNINVNKIVIKFNTLMSYPQFSLYINGSAVIVDGSTTITPVANADGYINGVVTLYWNGSAWTKTRWTTMPKFNSSGALTTYTTVNWISVQQLSSTATTDFSGYSNSNFTSDLSRMQLIEVSPRLEIDLTDFVKDVTINKSLDSKNNFVPISSINADDATINLSAIPIALSNGFVPIFSSQSNLSTNVLSNMLRKNIKFYTGWTLKSYFDSTANNFVQPNGSTGTYIPGGVFYSDSWDETDIKDVKITAYDITRYLQTTPVSDYAANLKPVFDVISNILELSGFSDYDADSLYDVCSDYTTPLDLSYFYANGRDSTIVDVLSEIFLAYQIGAYIDEYGIMRFKSLSQILNTKSSNITISDSSILQGGYTVLNKAKPGKLSLRYQVPKIKQTLAMQNATDPSARNSPSYVLTTSNDIMWSQETADSVGFNYLYSNMAETDNAYTINTNDLLDLFHTFTLSNNGYAVIEDELVSFVYKEYKLSQYSNQSNSTYVSVKNDIELNAEVNRFIKKYSVGLLSSNYSQITGASGNGSTITFTANNSFQTGQKVSVVGVIPAGYNGTGKILSATSSTFTVSGVTTSSYVSGGQATVSSDYDILVQPTGRVTNVQRGLFGTVPKAHSLASSASSKGLLEASINSSNVMSTGTTRTSVVTATAPLPTITKLAVSAPSATKCLVYPSQQDVGYHTYSVKFDLTNQQMATAGLFFNNNGSTSDGYFVELVQFNTINNKTAGPFYTVYNPPVYTYLISISKIISGTLTQIAWADVTGTVNNLILNNQQVFSKQTSSKGAVSYTTVSDNVFNLRVVHWTSDGTDATNSTGEDSGQLIKVFLNNCLVTGFQVPATVTTPLLTPNWKATDKNSSTGLRKNVVLSSTGFNTTNKYFGFCTSTYPFGIAGSQTVSGGVSSTVVPANLREIYANEKILWERSVNYWYQDREFLNAIVQKENIFNKYRSYIMQTNPEIVGVNVYDLQYSNPAAVTSDSYWGGYLLQYYPGTEVYDQAYKQQQVIDEYGLSFSTVLNTGFRAKMAITNNKNQMIYLAHKPDSNINVDSRFTIWTHEIVGPADPQVLQVVTDPSNATEVAQVDSSWIQSAESANKLISLMAKGFDGFAKDTTIQLFGNPLIQVGDVITINYSLSKINQQKYAVHSVSQAFNQGLKTTLVLNQIDKGVSY